MPSLCLLFSEINRPILLLHATGTDHVSIVQFRVTRRGMQLYMDLINVCIVFVIGSYSTAYFSRFFPNMHTVR